MSRTMAKSGGVELTDDVIERLAAEADSGYCLTRLRPRKCRPSMGLIPAAVFQVRLEPELRAALDRAAVRKRTSPGELARRALRAYLKDATRRKNSSAGRSRGTSSASPRRST
jgi:CRISPR-associated endonuclease/helicase Cas3